MIIFDNLNCLMQILVMIWYYRPNFEVLYTVILTLLLSKLPRLMSVHRDNDCV